MICILKGCGMSFAVYYKLASRLFGKLCKLVSDKITCNELLNQLNCTLKGCLLSLKMLSFYVQSVSTIHCRLKISLTNDGTLGWFSFGCKKAC